MRERRWKSQPTRRVEDERHVLDEDVDRRCDVVELARNHARPAVGQHPGAGGATAENFERQVERQALALCERQRFTCSRQVHAAEQLVQHLHLSAGACGAQVVDAGTEGLEHRARLIEGLARARTHDGERSPRGADRAPCDRRIHQQNRMLGEARCELAHIARVHRAAGDEHGAGRQLAHQSGVAKQHGLGLR